MPQAFRSARMELLRLAGAAAARKEGGASLGDGALFYPCGTVRMEGGQQAAARSCSERAPPPLWVVSAGSKPRAQRRDAWPRYAGVDITLSDPFGEAPFTALGATVAIASARGWGESEPRVSAKTTGTRLLQI